MNSSTFFKFAKAATPTVVVSFALHAVLFLGPKSSDSISISQIKSPAKTRRFASEGSPVIEQPKVKLPDDIVVTPITQQIRNELGGVVGAPYEGQELGKYKNRICGPPSPDIFAASKVVVLPWGHVPTGPRRHQLIREGKPVPHWLEHGYTTIQINDTSKPILLNLQTAGTNKVLIKTAPGVRLAGIIAPFHYLTVIGGIHPETPFYLGYPDEWKDGRPVGCPFFVPKEKAMAYEWGSYFRFQSNPIFREATHQATAAGRGIRLSHGGIDFFVNPEVDQENSTFTVN
ncbi:MAG: hypothetical protein U1E10_16030 [Bdellovibrionales bacterium]|nr:hypothetical protein [Bdellovibrionales bacterium]